MNNQFDNLMYEAGLTAQSCWDEMDEYDRNAILKFAELIVKECANVANSGIDPAESHLIGNDILEHFGVE